MEREQQVLGILARLCKKPAGELSPETELVADLGFDSAKALELVVEIEDAFDIEIDDEAVGRMHTVADVLAWIQDPQAAP